MKNTTQNKQYSTPSLDVTLWERKDVFLAVSADEDKDNIIQWSTNG
jgi:hypothetical protein